MAQIGRAAVGIVNCANFIPMIFFAIYFIVAPFHLAPLNTTEASTRKQETTTQQTTYSASQSRKMIRQKKLVVEIDPRDRPYCSKSKIAKIAKI